jgi:hypothetical protein
MRIDDSRASFGRRFIKTTIADLGYTDCSDYVIGHSGFI